MSKGNKSDLRDALNELRDSEDPNSEKTAVKEAYILFVAAVSNYDHPWFTEPLDELSEKDKDGNEIKRGRGLKPLPACLRDAEEIIKVFGKSNFKSNPRVIVDSNNVGGSTEFGQDPYHYSIISLNEDQDALKERQKEFNDRW